MVSRPSLSIDGRPLDVSVPAGFADAYQDHHGAVTAVARRVCGSDRAIDVTQDVFVTLWNDPENFDPSRGSLRSYLLVLAHHRAVDVLRSETARAAREQKVDAESPLAPTKVDDLLLCSEVATRVRLAVAGLPVDERKAIISSFYEHRSYQATAKWLEVPEGTIKSRIRRGLQRLHPLLSEIGDDGAGAAAGWSFDPATDEGGASRS